MERMGGGECIRVSQFSSNLIREGQGRCTPVCFSSGVGRNY